MFEGMSGNVIAMSYAGLFALDVGHISNVTVRWDT